MQMVAATPPPSAHIKAAIHSRETHEHLQRPSQHNTSEAYANMQSCMLFCIKSIPTLHWIDEGSLCSAAHCHFPLSKVGFGQPGFVFPPLLPSSRLCMWCSSPQRYLSSKCTFCCLECAVCCVCVVLCVANAHCVCCTSCCLECVVCC